ncbi:hypothetical protein M758_UG275900 [Ceratodon purpureus]|nr:hypothetical protein M758_UG275900 [Ceratodon purpureus]
MSIPHALLLAMSWQQHSDPLLADASLEMHVEVIPVAASSSVLDPADNTLPAASDDDIPTEFLTTGALEVTSSHASQIANGKEPEQTTMSTMANLERPLASRHGGSKNTELSSSSFETFMGFAATNPRRAIGALIACR